MRRQLVVMSALLLGGGRGGEAQENGHLLAMSALSPNLAGIFYAPPRGGWYIQVAPPGTIDPTARRHLAWLPGNRHLVVAENDYAASPSFPLLFSLFERDTGAYAPLFSVPPPFLAPSITIDQEGVLVIMGGSALYRVGANGVLQRIAPPNGQNIEGKTVREDLETGDYIVSATQNVYRVRPWGMMSTIASYPLPGVVRSQDPETGEFLLWGGTSLFRMTGTGTVTSTTITSQVNVEAMVVDETPSPLGEYAFSTGGRFINYLARVSRWGGTVTTLLDFTPTGSFGVDLVLDRPRNVSTANAGFSNRWNLFVDFPLDAGLPYVCLVGTSGYRPGVWLPDGRKIRLNPDGATWAGLAGLLPGFWGLSGVLDARGTAQGVMDLAGAGPQARGIPFWVVGVVLDPAAPSGIRRVSPPIVVQIR